jgi:hypothetical protein
MRYKILLNVRFYSCHVFVRIFGWRIAILKPASNSVHADETHPQFSRTFTHKDMKWVHLVGPFKQTAWAHYEPRHHYDAEFWPRVLNPNWRRFQIYW